MAISCALPLEAAHPDSRFQLNQRPTMHQSTKLQ